MICPDFETYEDLIKVFNEYGNTIRDDVSIIIESCDQSSLKGNQKCHSNNKIKNLLDQSLFSLSSLISIVDLGNKIEKSLSTRNVFHS